MNLLRGAMMIGAGLSMCAPAFAQTAAPAAPAAPAAAGAPAAGGAPGASIGPGWAAFSAIASSYTDSELTVDTKEAINGKQFDAVIRLQYKKPTLARCLVLQDTTPGTKSNKNAEIVWRGGSKIQAHPGDKYSAVVVVLDRTNPRVTDAVGFGCGQTSFDQIRDFFLAHGTVTEAAGPSIGGVATTAETLTPTDVKADYNMTKQVMYLSATSHLPLENIGYVGDKVVLDAKYSDIKLNPGLANSVFNLKAS